MNFSFFPSLLSFRFASREISTFGEIFSARKGERRLAAADEQFSVSSKSISPVPCRAFQRSPRFNGGRQLGIGSRSLAAILAHGRISIGRRENVPLGENRYKPWGPRVRERGQMSRGECARVGEICVGAWVSKNRDAGGARIDKKKKKFKKKVRRSVTLAFRFVPERKLKKERERLRRFG